MRCLSGRDLLERVGSDRVQSLSGGRVLERVRRHSAGHVRALSGRIILAGVSVHEMQSLSGRYVLERFWCDDDRGVRALQGWDIRERVGIHRLQPVSGGEVLERLGSDSLPDVRVRELLGGLRSVGLQPQPACAVEGLTGAALERQHAGFVRPGHS